MGKRAKKTILEMVARAGYVAANRAAGSASVYGYHQPKEPVALRRKCKKVSR